MTPLLQQALIGCCSKIGKESKIFLFLGAPAESVLGQPKTVNSKAIPTELIRQKVKCCEWRAYLRLHPLFTTTEMPGTRFTCKKCLPSLETKNSLWLNHGASLLQKGKEDSNISEKNVIRQLGAQRNIAHKTERNAIVSLKSESKLWGDEWKGCLKSRFAEIWDTKGSKTENDTGQFPHKKWRQSKSRQCKKIEPLRMRKYGWSCAPFSNN